MRSGVVVLQMVRFSSDDVGVMTALGAYLIVEQQPR